MKSKHSAEEKFQIVMESFTDNVTLIDIPTGIAVL